MSISSQSELAGMQAISELVAITLKQMREFAQPGMSCRELDEFGYEILKSQGARPAPKLMYDFPGWTCISVNEEIAHGIPSAQKILREGDLVNVDVSAELDGFFSDNGGSFILGNDLRNLNPLVNASKTILQKAISRIKGGVRISEIGGLIESEAKKSGFSVIKNLTGHGVGRSLHEDPEEIPCYNDRLNFKRFRKNSVVAIETFISTRATYAHEQNDGWTLKANDGSFVAQHEHTILVTDGEPLILTAANGIWNGF